MLARLLWNPLPNISSSVYTCQIEVLAGEVNNRLVCLRIGIDRARRNCAESVDQ